MSLPEYIGCRNSTTLVGSPAFGYASVDDRAGEACAFWHQPGVTPREMEHHEIPYAEMSSRNMRTPSPAPRSRQYSGESIDASRLIFVSHKRRFPFVGHSGGISDVSRLPVEGLLQESSADKDAIKLLTSGSDLLTGGSAVCVHNHAELTF